MIWFFWLALGLAATYIASRLEDKFLVGVFGFGTAFYVVASGAVALLNYIQLGRVIP